MKQERTFRFALIISLLIHTGVVLNPFGFKILSFKPKEQKIEINYFNLKSYPESLQERREIELKYNRTIKRKLPPPYVSRADIFKENIKSASLPKPILSKPDIISVKKIIQLKNIDMDKISNPIYINYYQIIREKIRRCAYKNYNRSDTGEVYLTFVVLSDGSLSQLKVILEKSCNNTYLQEIAFKSIKDASPFPSFPKELNYPQLSFNVIISFETE